MDLALVGLALGAKPVPAWNLLLPVYGFRGTDSWNFKLWFHAFMV